MLSSTSCENIVKSFGGHEAPDKKLWMLLEYAAGGHLGNIAHFNNYSPQQAEHPSWLSEETLLDVVRQVSNGLKYIHAAGISHRDIKCDNILITNWHGAHVWDFKKGCYRYVVQGATYKIADFGVSVLQNGSYSGPMGAPGFRAPELMELELHPQLRTLEQAIEESKGPAQDMWGLGCIAGA
ncbi:serine threonine protein [Pseudohyphozyma bogoriensis]|nr:serine threonine protein [Pseudohyphozyma bogoriensis]